ncbi:hypothetical protein HDU90_003237 [Geranomyces variabilis]|nr:hypothetical protein HDU90_003237 [Geranomyces variabilis]
MLAIDGPTFIDYAACVVEPGCLPSNRPELIDRFRQKATALRSLDLGSGKEHTVTNRPVVNRWSDAAVITDNSLTYVQFGGFHLDDGQFMDTLAHWTELTSFTAENALFHMEDDHEAYYGVDFAEYEGYDRRCDALIDRAPALSIFVFRNAAFNWDLLPSMLESVQPPLSCTRYSGYYWDLVNFLEFNLRSIMDILGPVRHMRQLSALMLLGHQSVSMRLSPSLRRLELGWCISKLTGAVPLVAASALPGLKTFIIHGAIISPDEVAQMLKILPVLELLELNSVQRMAQLSPSDAFQSCQLNMPFRPDWIAARDITAVPKTYSGYFYEVEASNADFLFEKVFLEGSALMRVPDLTVWTQQRENFPVSGL